MENKLIIFRLRCDDASRQMILGGKVIRPFREVGRAMSLSVFGTIPNARIQVTGPIMNKMNDVMFWIPEKRSNTLGNVVLFETEAWLKAPRKGNK